MVLEVMEKELGEYEQMIGGSSGSGSFEGLQIKAAEFEKTLVADFLTLEKKICDKIDREVDLFITKVVNSNRNDINKHNHS